MEIKHPIAKNVKGLDKVLTELYEELELRIESDANSLCKLIQDTPNSEAAKEIINSYEQRLNAESAVLKDAYPQVNRYGDDRAVIATGCAAVTGLGTVFGGGVFIDILTNSFWYAAFGGLGAGIVVGGVIGLIGFGLAMYRSKINERKKSWLHGVDNIYKLHHKQVEQKVKEKIVEFEKRYVADGKDTT